MYQTIGDVIGGLSAVLPPWAMLLLGAVVLVVAAPSWIHRMRAKQIKGALRKVARSRSEQERLLHIERAFTIADGRGRRLVAVAEEAIRAGQPMVWRRALNELEHTEQCALDVARIRTQLEGEKHGPRDVLEAIVQVERLLNMDLPVAAREKLDIALSHFPDDDELQALDHRVTQVLSTPSNENRA